MLGKKAYSMIQLISLGIASSSGFAIAEPLFSDKNISKINIQQFAPKDKGISNPRGYEPLPKGCHYGTPQPNKVTIICDKGNKHQVLHATIRCLTSDGNVHQHIGANIRANKGTSIARCRPGEQGPYRGEPTSPTAAASTASVRGWFSF